MQGMEGEEGRPGRPVTSKYAVAQWDRCSPSQVWGIPKRKGLEGRPRKGLQRNWGQGAALAKATQLRLVSGSPRRLILLPKTRIDNPTAGPDGPILSYRPIPIGWLVVNVWFLSPPCPVIPRKWSWSNYWYLEESNIPTLMDCYIKLHTKPILNTLGSFKEKCKRNLQFQHLNL